MAAKMASRLITSLFIFLTLTFTTFSHTSEARHFPQKPTKAVVVGTVYCDTCFNNRFSKPTHFISGASVVVECRDGRFRRQVKTNQLGEFSVELPFTVNREVKKINRCSVKLLTSSDPYCAVASTATSSSLHLKSRNSKLGSHSHIYSAGYFTFKPSHQPTLCSQNPTTTAAAGSNEQKDLSGFPLLPSPGGGGNDDDEPTLPPPVNTNPNGGVPPPEMNQNRLPPLPLLPRLPSLPPLPPLPTLPRLPYLPPWPGKSFNKHEKPSLRQGEGEREGDELSDQKSGRPGQPQGFLFPPILPPNPLQPPSPPSLPLPPNPLEPPSLVPPILPPNPLQPPPAPFLPIPPIPGLTPSPPVLPFPFPPPLFPLPPGFPGIPPAADAAQKSKSRSPSTIDP